MCVDNPFLIIFFRQTVLLQSELLLSSKMITMLNLRLWLLLLASARRYYCVCDLEDAMIYHVDACKEQ